MARKAVATLFCAPDSAEAWRTTERLCEHCSAAFLPSRPDQRFCPNGGACRLARLLAQAHRCRCGRACAGPDPSRCRRPFCDGALVLDVNGDGTETICLFCGRPGEPLDLPAPDPSRPHLIGAALPER